MSIDHKRLLITTRILEIAFDRLEDDHRSLEAELSDMNDSGKYEGTEPEYEEVENGVADVYSAMNDVQIAIDSLCDMERDIVAGDIATDDIIKAIAHV